MFGHSHEFWVLRNGIFGSDLRLSFLVCARTSRRGQGKHSLRRVRFRTNGKSGRDGAETPLVRESKPGLHVKAGKNRSAAAFPSTATQETHTIWVRKRR